MKTYLQIAVLVLMILSCVSCRKVNDITETAIEGVVKSAKIETITESTTEETTEQPTTEQIITEDEETEQYFTEIYEKTTKSWVKASTFYYDDGEVVYISAEEYYTICGVVMNEGGADYASYEGKVALAQCIRNQIVREKHLGHKYDIESVRQTYKEWYTKKPSEDVRKAVTDVFYNHQVVTAEPIIAWCATGYASAWHNKQIAVCSYDGNNFYKLSVKDW